MLININMYSMINYYQNLKCQPLVPKPKMHLKEFAFIHTSFQKCQIGILGIQVSQGSCKNPFTLCINCAVECMVHNFLLVQSSS